MSGLASRQQMLKTPSLGDIHLMTFLTQLLFKLWSPAHHTRRLMLAPKCQRGRKLWICIHLAWDGGKVVGSYKQGYHKMQGISCCLVELFASQEAQKYCQSTLYWSVAS